MQLWTLLSRRPSPYFVYDQTHAFFQPLVHPPAPIFFSIFALFLYLLSLLAVIQSVSLKVSAFFFSFPIALFVFPLVSHPPFFHLFPFLIRLSGRGTLNVWEWRQSQVFERKKKKKRHTKAQQSTLLFKQTLCGTSLRIAEVSQTWLAWPHDLWKFGSGVWHRQKHSCWQSGR